MAPSAPPSARAAAPALLALLLPALLFPGALPGPRVVSAQDHLSVHPAFQEQPGGRVAHPQLSDPALQFLSLRQAALRSLRRGEAPLWNREIYNGAPLLADAQSQPAAPRTLLALILAPAEAEDAATWLQLSWVGLGMAGLCRRLGLGAWGQAGAVAAALTSPFLHVWLLHPHATVAVWLPWLVWALEARTAWAVGLSVAGALCGGHPGTAAHVLALGLVWAMLRGRCWDNALGALAGLLMSAPVWLPVVELALGSTTAAARGGNQLEPAQLLDLLWPGWGGHPARGDWGGVGAWADGQLHPGLAALPLALSTLLLRRHRRLAQGLLLAWSLALVVSLLGLPGPINHSRLGSLAALALAPLVGLRLDQLPPRAAALGLALVVATGAWARRDDQQSLPLSEHQPAPAAWVGRLRQSLGCGEEGSCGPVLGQGWALQPNTGALVGLSDLRGYDLPISPTTQLLMAALSSPPRGPWYPVDALPPAPLRELLGLRAWLSMEAGAPEAGLEELDLGPAPLRAWALPAGAPELWWTDQAEPAAEPGLALRLSIAAEGGWRRPAVVGLEQALRGAGSVRSLDPQLEGEAALRVSLPPELPAGLVVHRQSWAPGWRARVDGRPAPVLAVAGVLQGVAVPAGARELQLYYRPDGWIWGLRLGALGLLLWLGACAQALRRAGGSDPSRPSPVASGGERGSR